MLGKQNVVVAPEGNKRSNHLFLNDQIDSSGRKSVGRNRFLKIRFIVAIAVICLFMYGIVCMEERLRYQWMKQFWH